jgi:elongation factor P
LDSETYEQISIARDLVGDAAQFLQDGMVVTVGTSRHAAL